jgi:hypothetical protein
MTLRSGDLSELIYSVFEIDEYKSKMGDDADVVVLSFTLYDKYAADDLVNFIEKGYVFVLDADATPVESDRGDYRVFVELDRDTHTVDNIMEIIDGVKKLTNKTDYRFRYYKGFKSYEVTSENVSAIVPTDAASYTGIVSESNMNNFKNFFNKSYLETLTLNDSILTLKKVYADPIRFEVLDFNTKQDIFDNLTESYNFNDFGEIIFLCKYVGDYNISKYGNKLIFENDDHLLVLRRI